jgi:hypothetical protein
MLHVKHFGTIGGKYPWPLTSGGLKPVRLRGKPLRLRGKAQDGGSKSAGPASKRTGLALPEERKGGTIKLKSAIRKILEQLRRNVFCITTVVMEAAPHRCGVLWPYARH